MKQPMSADELEAYIISRINSPNYKPRMTSKKAAEILGVSLRTLRRWERAGITPQRNEGYYRHEYVKAEIEAFAKMRHDKKLKSKSRRKVVTQ